MSERKRIAILNFDISDNSLGRAYILAKALSKDYDVEILGPSRKSSIWEPLKNADVPIRELPYKRLPLLLFKLPSILKEIDADIIYAVKPRFTSFGFGLLKSFFHKRPLLLDIDDWEVGFYLRKPILSRAVQLIHVTNPNGFFWTWLMQKFIRYADSVTTVSSFLRDRYGGEIIPHAKDTDYLNPNRFNAEEIKKNLGWDSYRIVMFLGTPREHKGVEDALEAVLMIKRQDLKMAIVGADPESEYERRLKQLGGDSVLLIGRVPIEDVPKYLMAADVVVIPQRATTDTAGQIPSKLFDAMAMAKPIISTRVSDIPEILKDCGTVVEPGSSAQLRKAIEYLLEHPDEAKQMGERARQRCIEHYSINAVAKRLKKLINEVTGEDH